MAAVLRLASAESSVSDGIWECTFLGVSLNDRTGVEKVGGHRYRRSRLTV
jgi:hypothetical protein